MKITEIAARLRKTAANMEVLAIREGDFDFPEEAVLPLIVNTFTDDNVLRFATAAPLTETSGEPRG
jgi:hypothetical protein